MNRLILSGLERLKKNKLFWIGIILIAGYGIFCCLTSYELVKEYDVKISLDEMQFMTIPFLGIVLAVIVSLFIGTDYHDGTIRNKIISGKTRCSIYFSNFLLCMIVGILIYVIGLLGTYAVGRPLYGELVMESDVFCELFFSGIFMTISYAAIFNFVAMMNTNKAYGAVFGVLLVFGMMFLAVYLYQALNQPEMVEQAAKLVGEQIEMEMVKNPRYVTGIKRDIYQLIVAVLPNGQGFMIGGCEVSHSFRMMGYSVILIVVFNLLGAFCFQKKNLK